VAAVISLSVASAPAQTDKMREPMARETVKLLKSTNRVNGICGSHFTAEFDWRGIKSISEADFQGPADKCGDALVGIEYVCRDALGKEAVQNQIKGLTCSFGPEPTLTFRDGRLDYRMDPSYGNFRSGISNWQFIKMTLEKAL
jgi:hypothetical protein